MYTIPGARLNAFNAFHTNLVFTAIYKHDQYLHCLWEMKSAFRTDSLLHAPYPLSCPALDEGAAALPYMLKSTEF